MAEGKAEKAKEEIAWKKAGVFVRALEEFLEGKGGRKQKDAQGGAGGLLEIGENEGRWLAESYKKAGKAERRLFLKTVLHAIYGLGAGEGGKAALSWIVGKMAADGAHCGELYDYLMQYGNEKVAGSGTRLGAAVSATGKESGIDDEYYQWFNREFKVPKQEVWRRYPALFTAKSPGQIKEERKKASWKSLRKILSSLYHMHMGNAVLSRIRDYMEKGGLAKLSLENERRAARLAGILFEFGLEDVGQNGNMVTLGLRETIYDARKSIAGGGGTHVPAVGAYLDYFRDNLPGGEYSGELPGLIESGMESEAAERMCRAVLQECKKSYLILGQKKYTFGSEGEKMIEHFKSHVGREGDASLLSVYDMIIREDYARALEKLRAIVTALKEVRGEYPHMFLT